jgi:hypothetical protein
MEYLSGDQLARCSLVCKSWGHYAQNCLFNSVTVDVFPPTSWSAFVNIFSARRRDLPAFILSNPNRGILFKHLRYTAQNHRMSSVYEALPYCTQLRSLTLSCNLAPSFLQRVSAESFPVLEKLILTRILSFATALQCFQSMSRYLRLKELALSLAQGYTENALDIPQDPFCLAPLRIFSFFDPDGTSSTSFGVLFKYLRPVLLQLRRLIVHTTAFYSANVMQLIEDNWATIESLDTSQVFGVSDRLSRIVNNNALRDLVLHFPVLSSEISEYLAALEAIFLDPAYSPSSLRHISFLISSTYALFDLARHSDLWERLANALCRFSTLETVGLLLEPYIGFVEEYDSGMFASTVDLDIHPAFDALRKMGRLRVAYHT